MTEDKIPFSKAIWEGYMAQIERCEGCGKELDKRQDYIVEWIYYEEGNIKEEAFFCSPKCMILKCVEMGFMPSNIELIAKAAIGSAESMLLLKLKEQEQKPSPPMVPSSNVYGAWVEDSGKVILGREKRKRKENLCRYCPPEIKGLCCYWSAIVNGLQIVADDCCEFFDKQTKKCTVYKERFEKNPNCLTVEEMKKLGTLPRKCPYVQFDREYQARTDLRLYKNEFELVVKE